MLRSGRCIEELVYSFRSVFLKITEVRKLIMKKAFVENIKIEPINVEEITGYQGIYNKYIKRIIDFLLAIIFFIILVPVYIVVSLFIIVETGFPVLYKAERGGYKGNSFRIYKFRTMVKDADKIGGGTTAFNDRRITR